jgi:hypothetical protein
MGALFLGLVLNGWNLAGRFEDFKVLELWGKSNSFRPQAGGSLSFV